MTGLFARFVNGLDTNGNPIAKSESAPQGTIFAEDLNPMLDGIEGSVAKAGDAISGPLTWTMPTPTGTPTATASATGGTLATATYYYRIVAFDANSGRTLPGPEVSVAVTGPTGSVALSWTPVPGADAYRIYRGTTAGGQNTWFGTTDAPRWTDTGAAGNAGVPPTTNTALAKRLASDGDGWLTAKRLLMRGHIKGSDNNRLILRGNDNGVSINKLITLEAVGPYDRPWISWIDHNGRHRVGFGYHTLNPSGNEVHAALEVKTSANPAGATPGDMRTRFSIGTDADRVLFGFNYVSDVDINQAESAPDIPFGIIQRGRTALGASTKLSQWRSLLAATTEDTITDFDVLTADATKNATLRLFRSTNTSGARRFSIMKGDGTNTEIFGFNPADGSIVAVTTSGSILRFNDGSGGTTNGIWGSSIGLVSAGGEARIVSRSNIPIVFQTGGTINSLAAGTERMRLGTDGILNLATAAAEYRIAGLKAVAARVTGWAAPTGIRTRTTFDPATVTLVQLAERVAALLEDLGAGAVAGKHGLIGA